MSVDEEGDFRQEERAGQAKEEEEAPVPAITVVDLKRNSIAATPLSCSTCASLSNTTSAAFPGRA